MSSQMVGDYIPGDPTMRVPNYINGRPLTAEDLKADQEANLTREAWQNKATGHGVIDGLLVERLDSKRVRVYPGAGLNRQGQLVVLPSVVTLDLNPELDQQTLIDAALFGECEFKPSAVGTTLAGGAYVLAVTPVQKREGSTAVRGTTGSGGCNGGAVSSSGSATACVAKWLAEGVQFKIVRLAGFSAGQNSRLRNLLAAYCFGAGSLPDLSANPFTFEDAFTGLDSISADDLTECDLPLAVLWWRANQELDFVDIWPARRRLVRPGALHGFSGLLSDRRVALAQARFLQFQDQVGGLTNKPKVVASEHFRYLPPVGYIPIRMPEFLAKRLLKEARLEAAEGEAITKSLRTALSADYEVEVFFKGVRPRSVGLMERDSVDFYLQRSWYDEAIDLDDEPVFDLYIPKESLAQYMTQRLPEEPGVYFKRVKETGVSASSLPLLDLLADTQLEGLKTTPKLYAMFVKKVPKPEYISLSTRTKTAKVIG